ncbi:hypothetical protein [Pseudonocardia sp. HH130630-07]|uniref:hypothetical protein n=1 Tax=Pseudonocardia sp. HH130630-07 TaxID=1690815 RepID=UPI0012EAC59B|nr:hypothetical protein [Pseudonocardia sp. HH130630-07]
MSGREEMTSRRSFWGRWSQPRAGVLDDVLGRIERGEIALVGTERVAHVRNPQTGRLAERVSRRHERALVRLFEQDRIRARAPWLEILDDGSDELVAKLGTDTGWGEGLHDVEDDTRGADADADAQAPPSDEAPSAGEERSVGRVKNRALAAAARDQARVAQSAGRRSIAEWLQVQALVWEARAQADTDGAELDVPVAGEDVSAAAVNEVQWRTLCELDRRGGSLDEPASVRAEAAAVAESLSARTGVDVERLRVQANHAVELYCTDRGLDSDPDRFAPPRWDELTGDTTRAHVELQLGPVLRPGRDSDGAAQSGRGEDVQAPGDVGAGDRPVPAVPEQSGRVETEWEIVERLQDEPVEDHPFTSWAFIEGTHPRQHDPLVRDPATLESCAPADRPATYWSYPDPAEAAAQRAREESFAKSRATAERLRDEPVEDHPLTLELFLDGQHPRQHDPLVRDPKVIDACEVNRPDTFWTSTDPATITNAHRLDGAEFPGPRHDAAEPADRADRAAARSGEPRERDDAAPPVDAEQGDPLARQVTTSCAAAYADAADDADTDQSPAVAAGSRVDVDDDTEEAGR